MICILLQTGYIYIYTAVLRRAVVLISSEKGLALKLGNDSYAAGKLDDLVYDIQVF